MTVSSVVVIGAGIAGFSAVTELRRLGHSGPVTIVDSEPGSYDRPPLSKRLFEDDFTLDSVAFATGERFAELAVDTKFNTAVRSVDPATRTVALDDGSTLEADAVVIATGGTARTLPIPGADLEEVSVLRTYEDAEQLRGRITEGRRVAVVGAGLIGAELASSFLEVGADVTLIDPVEVPLVPAVGELLATAVHAMHGGRGIRVVTGLTESFTAVEDGIRVDVRDHEPVTVDHVVVGVGMVPDTSLAEQAGVDCDDGILVDDNFATSVPGIYAAGDVARHRTSDGQLARRAEHWEAAQFAGQAVAHAILGLEVPVQGAGWFWSDRHGHHLEAVGRLSGDGEVVVREGGEYPTVFLVDDGVLVGAAAVDEPKTIRAARGLIDKGIPVTVGELSDPSVQLRKLLKVKK
ncbi:MAG TPA: FAD-dependent oxidoreductase [Candidatus Corynebacterium avicola]|uniref:FAD-dependent oxidoreductase n=1 Tax=Candidatus Corynebacterium avicola TaxID=2838527 RepID=A0A9D1UM63_9CORY|nr:FAD-dependent oxidoreductase [Candidatus Corynebacterium avicola]